jgi:hypothetical protein
MDGNKLEFACCFCGQDIAPADMLVISVNAPDDIHEKQNFYSHRRCFKERILPSIPLTPELE